MDQEAESDKLNEHNTKKELSISSLSNSQENTNTNEQHSTRDAIIFYWKIFAGNFVYLLSRFFQRLLTTSFLGLKYDNPHMIDAVGIAHVYAFLGIFSFCAANYNTLDLLGSRAFGQKNYFHYGIILHRTFIMTYLMWIILFIIHCFTAAPLMMVFNMEVRQYEYFDEYLKYFEIRSVPRCSSLE